MRHWMAWVPTKETRRSLCAVNRHIATIANADALSDSCFVQCQTRRMGQNRKQLQSLWLWVLECCVCVCVRVGLAQITGDASPSFLTRSTNQLCRNVAVLWRRQSKWPNSGGVKPFRFFSASFEQNWCSIFMNTVHTSEHVLYW